MSRAEFRKVTQKDFVQTVRNHAPPVFYEYPGIFTAGEVRVRIKSGQLGNFLAKLSPAMSFEDYDHLTREVWVANMRAEDPKGLASPKPITRRYPSPEPE